MAITREDVVREARKLIRIPFHHQGRCRAGVDCIGELALTAKALGIPHTDSTNYSRRAKRETLEAGLERAGLVRIEGEWGLGDVLELFFKKNLYHVGIVGNYHAGGPSIIHTYAQVERVVEHALTDEWRKRIVAAWRFPGVID